MKKVLAVLGGGQLGRMLALAGIPLGFSFRFLDPSSDGEPVRNLGEFKQGSFQDKENINWLRDSSLALTYELEHVATDAISDIPLSPPLLPLKVTQNRVSEKDFIKGLGLKVAEFKAITGATSEERVKELREGFKALGAGSILKTAFQGYDGKGQEVLDCVEKGFSIVKAGTAVLEKRIPFEMEASLISVRNKKGEIKHYPLTVNHHEGGILRWSVAIPKKESKFQVEAEEINHNLLEAFNYVGVMTTEFFICKNVLYINEIAPRVHNSGHWTIEGARTSQFENHIRAVAGLPLGSTEAVGPSLMVNVLGVDPDLESLLQTPNSFFHWYGKEARPLRKVGHLTVVQEKGTFDELKVLAVSLSSKVQSDKVKS